VVARTHPSSGVPVLLNEFDKEEWRIIAVRLRPEWTEEEFEDSWNEFVALRVRKVLS